MATTQDNHMTTNDSDGFEDAVPLPRIRKIRSEVHTIVCELPDDVHEDDIIDTLWGILGELNPNEEAEAIKYLRTIR